MAEPDARRAWVDHAIFWQVYPLGFLGVDQPASTGGPSSGARTLRDLVNWLDYLLRLGANGLLLGPVFASSTHGYDTTDHLAVDARLGDDDAFDHLVREAHDRGIRVLLDGVFNHVGREHGIVQAALAEGPGGPHEGWFHLYWPASGDGQPEYEHFEGHRSLVTLNHASPAVRDYVVEVMCSWLDRGADGWRLDAAYAVPMDFWAAVLPRVRQRHPEAFIVGEVIHGDYAAFVTQGGLDSVTEYELWKALWSSMNDANFHELAWTLSRHDDLLRTFVPLTFLGNHDVTRIASRLDDVRHVPHALAALMTLGGTPTIYYGDEQGLRGVKQDRVGGDDAVRPPFPADPEGLPPDGWPVFHLHQELISVRRRHPWLHHARTTVGHVTNAHIVWSSRADTDAVITALSTDDAPVSLPVPGATGVLAGPGRMDGEGAAATVSLEPHGWAVLAATAPAAGIGD